MKLIYVTNMCDLSGHGNDHDHSLCTNRLPFTSTSSETGCKGWRRSHNWNLKEKNMGSTPKEASMSAKALKARVRGCQGA